MSVDLEVRELTAEDLPAAWALGRLAFGGPADGQPPPILKNDEDVTRWGAFDGSGRLIGKAYDLHHEQWWADRRVVSSGVAGVAVRPETRGRGIGRGLLTALLAGARERGAAVSALFPSVAAVYRSFGWEVGGAVAIRDVAAAALPRHHALAASKLTVRPGGGEDLPRLLDLYERVARSRCGLLTRRGVLFPFAAAESLPAGIDGLTLVEDGDQLVGYANWTRGNGYGPDAVLTIHDLLSTTAEAAAELVSVLAGWRSITGIVRVRILPGDPTSFLLPLESSRENVHDVWMHRPVDVVRAVEQRGWPVHARGSVTFELHDPLAPWNWGVWRLEVADGVGRLERTDGEVALRLSVNGFGALYAGAAGAASLVQAGMLQTRSGGDPTALDLLASGGPSHLLNHF